MDNKALKYILAAALPVMLFCMAGRGAAQQPPAAGAVADTVPVDIVTVNAAPVDTLPGGMAAGDSTDVAVLGTGADSATVAPRPRRAALEEPLTGTAEDSIVFDVRSERWYIYNKGDIYYQDKNIKADYMDIDMETQDIFAGGHADSLGKVTRPAFLDGDQSFMMNTLIYNLHSMKARINGITTQQGEGYLQGEIVKKMPDNTINIMHGMYTTCDHEDCPHFYINMRRARFLPGKKAIVEIANLVMEDVPIPFPFLPIGFFPLTTGRSSGFITPTFGEETVKGFFIRQGGYYFAVSDHVDFTVLGSIYTLGSWDASVSSRYIKRYKYAGNLSTTYASTVIEQENGKKINSNNFRLGWAHTQDPKFRPNTTFSASVNFSTSGYNKYSTTSLNEYLSTQTNSSISYSKRWPGKPFSLSTSFNHSQNSRDESVSMTLPNLSFNVSRIFPLKRRERVGRERWYEKLSMTYALTMQNSIQSKESELFTDRTLKNMRNGVSHSIPLSLPLNVLGYINFTPSMSYNERWYFKRIDREWDPARNAVAADTTYGFYPVRDYRVSAGVTTKLYGMYTFRNDAMIRAVRHVMTPSVSMSYNPGFGDPRYGYYKTYQSDSTGNISTYSPFESGMYGVPGRQKSATMSFSLTQNIEAKFRSGRDSSGVVKKKIIDNLSLSSSYNFMADSLNLALISARLSTPLFPGYVLMFGATLDPYQIDHRGTKINRFMIEKGKLARLTNLNTSFSYTLNSTKLGGHGMAVMNDITTADMLPPEQQFFVDGSPTPTMQRATMASRYYDFSIPWNVGLSYTYNYSKAGLRASTQQNINFQGSVTVTQKWGLNFSGGYDISRKELIPGQIYITRDLHCWQMNFTWVPFGAMKQWSFNISVRSSLLSDIKVDKRSSRFDNLYDTF